MDTPVTRKRARVTTVSTHATRKKSRTVRGPLALSVNRIPRTTFGFPKTQRCKLRWSYFAPLTINAGTPAAVNVRANGPSDPNADIGGNQPRAFVEWSNFYNKYTCLGSRIHMRLLDRDTGTGVTGTVTGLFGIALRDTTNVVTAVETYIEDDKAKYAGFDSWHANAKVTNYVDIAKHFTVKDILDDDSLQGTTGTLASVVPTQQAYWKCWATQAPASGASAQTFVAEILVEYDIVFTDPKDLSSS